MNSRVVLLVIAASVAISCEAFADDIRTSALSGETFGDGHWLIDDRSTDRLFLARNQEDPRRGSRRSAREQSNVSQKDVQTSDANEARAFSAQEACNFVLSDFDYETWTKRYLDYYDKWFDMPVSEAEVIAYQAGEAEKMGRIYRAPPWRTDIWKVRRIKYEAAYGDDLTSQEKSALLATGWPKTNQPLEYFQKVTEGFGKWKCDSVPGGGSPPGLYFGAVQQMSFECNKYRSATEKMPCENIFLGAVARRVGNYDIALAEFNALAGEGSADAMFQIADMHLNGEGVASNKQTAIDWFVGAGEAGNKEAVSRLAKMYENKEWDAAIDWFKSIGNAGSEQAMDYLAQWYDSGVWIPRDNAAMEWFMSAGKGGHKPSNKVVGDTLYYGKGVPVNRTEAVRWYSAAFGIDRPSDAQIAYNIGSALEEVGNIPMAGLCYTKASRKGEEDAEFVVTAREKLSAWALAGARLQQDGVSAYSEDARMYGYDFFPIDRRYSLEGVNPLTVLPPCETSIAEFMQEGGFRGLKTVWDTLAEHGRRN